MRTSESASIEGNEKASELLTSLAVTVVDEKKLPRHSVQACTKEKQLVLQRDSRSYHQHFIIIYSFYC